MADRSKLLTESVYMFKTENEPGEMILSLYELAADCLQEHDDVFEDPKDTVFFIPVEEIDRNEILFQWADDINKGYIKFYFESIPSIQHGNTPAFILFEYDGCVYGFHPTEMMEFCPEFESLQIDDFIDECEQILVSCNIQDWEGCSKIVSGLFNSVINLYKDDLNENSEFTLECVNEDDCDEIEESVSIEKIEDKFETNDITRSKLVGDLFDDPEESEEKRQYKRKLKKYGGVPQQQQQGGGMFGESLYIGRGYHLVLNEYEYAKKEPMPMDIVEFQGEQCQILAANADGTYTLMYKGCTVDGISKRQIKQISWSDLSTPLQFGKFDQFGNPSFTENPWDDKITKFGDLNGKPQLIRVDLKANGKTYNESFAYFTDLANEFKQVRVLNEDMQTFSMIPLEDVEPAQPVNYDEWPYAVIVVNEFSEEPQRKIRVNPVSYCQAETDDTDVEVLLSPSTNDEPSKLKKKFIRILA